MVVPPGKSEVELVTTEEPRSSKDERDFRPTSLKELYAHNKYNPYMWVYTKSDGSKVDLNVGCWLNCQDIAIICTCFMTLWSTLLGIYVLLLKSALDTDEKSTALWIYFTFGCIFVIFVAGSVAMNSIEEKLNSIYKSDTEQTSNEATA